MHGRATFVGISNSIVVLFFLIGLHWRFSASQVLPPFASSSHSSQFGSGAAVWLAAGEQARVQSANWAREERPEAAI